MIKFILNNNGLHWLSLIKAGIIFILIGLLILLFKEFVVVLIASIFMLIGALMFYLAFTLWNQKKTFD